MSWKVVYWMLLVASCMLTTRVMQVAALEDDEGREVKVDKPFLIVEKSVPQKVSVDQTFPVKITLYNAGESGAFDVVVEDLAWTSGANAEIFKVKGGDENLSEKFEKIDAQSNVTITFEVKGKASGLYKIPPSIISYKGYADEKKTTSYSTKPENLRVMSMLEAQLQVFAPIFSIISYDFFGGAGEWYYFLALGVISIIVYMGFHFYEQAKITRRTMLQAKYEKELLKSE